METFIRLLQRIKSEMGYETTGEALSELLKLADWTNYTDWKIEDLNEVMKRRSTSSPNVIFDPKMKALTLIPDFGLDLFYLPFGIGANICSQPLAKDFLMSGVSGFYLYEIQLDPLKKIFPNDREYHAPDVVDTDFS